MTDNEILELKTVVDAWLKEKSIPNAGVEVIIRIVPLRVIIDVPSRDGESKLVELSEADWEKILGFPMKKHLLELLTLLKERKNAGVFKADIGDRDLPNAAQVISNVFRKNKAPYRFVCRASEGNYTVGPYRIRLMS